MQYQTLCPSKKGAERSGTGRTFTLNGTTRTPWVPEAVPAGAVSLSDLPESDWNALVQQMLSDSLTAQPAGE